MAADLKPFFMKLDADPPPDLPCLTAPSVLTLGLLGSLKLDFDQFETTNCSPRGFDRLGKRD